MASHLALLLLSALARALSQPDPCEYETNRIKDLLQASCEGKGLTKVPPGLDQDTGILLLGSNRLTQVSTTSFEQLRNLTDLDLSRNGMEQLEATSPLSSLQDLDLSHNALQDLPSLQGFPNLVCLALGHNALSQLPEGGFRTLKHLVDLELQGNQLQSLPEGAFKGLAALKDLDLSDNRLRILPSELLEELKVLETLRLERNRLQSVPEGFFLEDHIFAYVYLIGNPWLCDCALEYLHDWIVDNEFSVYTRVQGPEKEITENQPENVTCHDPPEERGRPVMNFQLDCEAESDRGIRGDEDISDPWIDPVPTTLGPESSPDVLSTPSFPVTTTAFFTQPEPSSPGPPTPSLSTSRATPLAHSPTAAAPRSSFITMGSLVTTLPTVRELQTAPTTSTLGLPPASSAAPPLAHSPTSTGPPRSSPTTLGSQTTTFPTVRELQTALTTSTLGLPPASSTATPTAHSPTSTSPPSPSPTTLGSLATTLPTSGGLQTVSSTSISDLSPASTTATPGSGEPVTTPPQDMSTMQAMPAPTTSFMLPATTRTGSTVHPPTPPPPASCHCPMLPGMALGLTSRQSPSVSWRGWLAARCCPLRLALYVACLVLVFLSTLAVLCWWVCECVGTRPLRSTQRAPRPQLVKYEQLQNVALERCHVAGEGSQALPGRRLYRVCKRLEIAPLRYVTWLLVSLPGPSRQWPWERMDSFPLYSSDQGEDTLGSVQVKYAASTL